MHVAENQALKWTLAYQLCKRQHHTVGHPADKMCREGPVVLALAEPLPGSALAVVAWHPQLQAVPSGLCLFVCGAYRSLSRGPVLSLALP